MQEAITEAKKGPKAGECPVGAVIVRNGQIITRAHNLKETKKNPVLHAEIAAIQKACEILDSYYLNDCELYVTLEPCVMCAGAIVNARLKRLYFGAYDPKAGAAGSVTDIFNIRELNHKPEIYCGIMEDECSELLKRFFKKMR